MDLQKKQNLNIYIGVVCVQQCRYQINPTLQSIIELDLNVELAIGLTEKDSKIFKVRIPASSEEGGSLDSQIKSITILASPMIASPANSQSDLILTSTAVQGEIPSTSQQKCTIGEPVWTQGKAIRLTENSQIGAKIYDQNDNSQIIKQWCTDCWLTILLSVQREGKYSIIVKASLGEAQIIYEDSVILGVAQFGEQECYKYNVKDPSLDLDVRFKTYSGILSHSINPIEIPKNFKDSEFKIYSDSLDTFTKLTSEMRNKTSKGDRKVGPYLICVFAHTTSSYQILVRETNPLQQYELIEDGFAYNSEIKSQIQIISKQIFVYQVPTLDYDEQDIKLSFELEASSGQVPNMAIKYCNQFQDDKEQDSEQLINKCAQNEINSTPLEIIQKIKNQNNSEYYWAQQVHGIPYVFQEIDHDEKSCKFGNQKERNSNCYYIIVILSNSPDELVGQTQSSNQEQITKFKLVVSKIQKNYQILRAQQPMIGQVERNEVKFYNHRFYGNDKVQKISIQLNTIHGDADLYVSRSNIFPQSKEDSDKISSKSRGVLDSVEFDKSVNDSLAGEYYIGVKGFSQSIYELQIRFQLEGQSSWNIMNLEELDKDSKWLKLSQGVEKQSDIHNENTRDYYRFTVDMDSGFERTIRIHIRKRNDNDVWVFVAYNRPCTDTDYDFFPVNQLGDKLIEIAVNTDHYHAKGTYYIMISPRIKNIFAFFSDDWYSYAIKYSLDGSFDYIHPQQVVTQKQTQNRVQQYKFIIENRLQTQRLNINVIEGKILFKTSFDANEVKNFQYNQNSSDIITQGNRISKPITRQQIQDKSNIKCRDPLSNCIFYIGIKCLTSDKDCYYDLKIQSKDDGLQQIIFGLPIQNTIEQINMNYYYITINEKSILKNKPIYIVLTTDDDGDADMYVSLQENSDIIEKKNWTKPTTTNYDYKSQEFIQQDIIIIQNDEIMDCFQNSKKAQIFKKFKVQEQFSECSIIIGIYGTPLQQFTLYELISYMNVQHLSAEKSVQSFVDENDYQYFVYEVNCDDCALNIGLQTFSGGNPDLYINFGDNQLPDKEKYSFKSTSYSSESLEISLKDQYFENNSIKSMRGTYIIGVYGQLKSTFILSATHNKYPMIVLQDQIQFHDSQQKYETKIFKYDPDQGNNMDDIKIQISVKSGCVDLYINTYQQEEDFQNLIQKLPISKKQSIYFLENVKPTSQISETEIIIQIGDRNYCQKCLYLIGIHSHEEPADYEIKVQLLSADFINSHFLKVGYPQTTILEPNQTYVFKFLLDEKEDVVIYQENQFGNTQTYLSTSAQKDESFENFVNSSVIILGTVSKNFKTAQVYYIIVECNKKSMITITVSQKHSIIDFKNGQTEKIIFSDENDISKNFIMSLPKGESILTIQIQPIYTNQNFMSKPILFYKFFENIGEVRDKINFPPNGEPDFLMKRQYQGREYLQLSQKINITKNDEGVAFTLWLQHNNDKQNVQHQVIVFASTSNEHILVKNQEYLKTMFPSEKTQYLKLQQSLMHSQETYTFIEYSNCFGSQYFQFFQNPEDPQTQIQVDGKFELNGKYEFRFKNPLPSNDFYIVVQGEMSDPKINYLDKEGERSQYTIRVFGSNQQFLFGRIKTVSDYIQNEVSSSKNNLLLLKWEGLKEFPNINETNSSPREMKDEVNYFVFYTENNQANLSSVCTFEDEVWRANGYKKFQTQNMSTQHQIALTKGKNYQINVFAQVTKGQNKGYLYPYHQFQYFIPADQESQIKQSSNNSAQGFFLIIFALLFILAGVCVFYLIQNIINRSSNQEESILQRFFRKIRYQVLRRNILVQRNRTVEQQQQHELSQYGGMHNLTTVDSQKQDQTYEEHTV